MMGNIFSKSFNGCENGGRNFGMHVATAYGIKQIA